MYSRRRARRSRIVVIGLALLSALTLEQSPARVYRGLRVPNGYRVSNRAIAPGVSIFTLNRPGRAVLRIARLRHDSAYGLRVLVSNNRVAGRWPRLERTTRMCRRARCLAAVNADFFSFRSGVPGGGLVVRGEPVRSPRLGRPQLVVAPDGKLGVRKDFRFFASLSAEHPRYPALGPFTDYFDVTRSTRISAVNWHRWKDSIMLYTRWFGSRTGTNRYGAELTVRFPSKTSRLRLGSPMEVEAVSFRWGRGNARIPKGGAVLSGHGTGARSLARLWKDIKAGLARPTLRLSVRSSAPAMESVGGKPILLRAGKRMFRRGSYYARRRAPQTVVGWTSSGDVLLVAVDGRRPGYSAGMTLREVTGLLRAFGVRNAMALDGGGSTSFVVRGRLANVPSDRLVVRNGHRRVVRFTRKGDRVVRALERPVATALAIVRAS